MHRAHDKRADPPLRAPPRSRLLAGLALARRLAGGLRPLRNGPLQRRSVPAVRGDLVAARCVPFGSVRLGANRLRLRAGGVEGAQLVQSLTRPKTSSEIFRGRALGPGSAGGRLFCFSVESLETIIWASRYCSPP